MDRLRMYVVKILRQASLPLFLLAIFCLDQWQMDIACFATYAQYPALKSVYEKSQYVTAGKLFSSYSAMFELAQGLWDPKISDLNYLYEALVHKEALIIYQDRICAQFYVFYHYHQF